MRTVKHRAHIHTIVELMPQHYAHTMNCHHNVLTYKNYVFRTMLTKDELQDFAAMLLSRHGDKVKVSQRWKWKHRSVKVKYAPERFQANDNTLHELKSEIYYQLLNGCIKSHLPITPVATVNC